MGDDFGQSYMCIRVANISLLCHGGRICSASTLSLVKIYQDHAHQNYSRQLENE
jgi:hypothetical protein